MVNGKNKKITCTWGISQGKFAWVRTEGGNTQITEEKILETLLKVERDLGDDLTQYIPKSGMWNAFKW